MVDCCLCKYIVHTQYERELCAHKPQTQMHNRSSLHLKTTSFSTFADFNFSAAKRTQQQSVSRGELFSPACLCRALPKEMWRSKVLQDQPHYLSLMVLQAESEREEKNASKISSMLLALAKSEDKENASRHKSSSIQLLNRTKQQLLNNSIQLWEMDKYTS